MQPVQRKSQRDRQFLPFGKQSFRICAVHIGSPRFQFARKQEGYAGISRYNRLR